MQKDTVSKNKLGQQDALTWGTFHIIWNELRLCSKVLLRDH